MDRGRTMLVGVAAMALVLAGCGSTAASKRTIATTTSTTTPTTTTSIPASLQPEVLPCEPPSPLPASEGHPGIAYAVPEIKPSTIYIACGAADPSEAAYFSNLTWTTWGASSAAGTGDYTVDSCIPDCASAIPDTYPATVNLSQPVEVAGYPFPLFTLLNIHFTGIPPSVGLGFTEVTPTDFTEQFPGMCPQGACS